MHGVTTTPRPGRASGREKVLAGCFATGLGFKTMNADAIPPKLPSVFDLLRRPVAAEIRPAPLLPPMFTVTYCEGSAPRRDEDDDPPRMLRVFSTSSGAPPSRSYDNCDRYAAFAGQPYTVDVRWWDAESGFIIERMNHDYSLKFTMRRS